MGCGLVFGIALYLLLTFVAAWLISDGFQISVSMLAILMIALLWPVFLVIILISYYEEWRYRQRSR